MHMQLNHTSFESLLKVYFDSHARVILCAFFKLTWNCIAFQNHHERAGLYSLDEEDVLTHYGQSLANINFNDADYVLSGDEDG